MSWKRYLVHLSVLCLLGTAVAFAHPFAGIVHDGATYRDVEAQGRSSAGVVDVQQRTVQLEAEMRAMKRAYRELDVQDSVAVPAMTFHRQWLAIEEEMGLLQDEQIRFLAERSAREAGAAYAAADCFELP